MDTTNQYIEMCRKAGEIQELWVPSCSDYVVSPTTGFFEIYSSRELENAIRYKNDYIWLPRQDQLQEMLITIFEDKNKTAYVPVKMPQYRNNYLCRSMIGSFDSYIHRNSPARDECIWQFSSMEQLWLAYVMEKKFNKTWNGGNWIKSEGEDGN